MRAVYQVVFVPVGGVVGAGHNDTRGPGVVSGAEDVVRHLDVLFLVEEVVERVSGPPLVAEVNDRIHPLEQRGVGSAVWVNQVLYDDSLHLLTPAIGVVHVHQDCLIAFLERGQQLVRYISGGSGQQDFCHWCLFLPFHYVLFLLRSLGGLQSPL